jgi:hypothetical protein
MKSSTMLKSLGVAAVFSLALAGQAAHAGGCLPFATGTSGSCPRSEATMPPQDAFAARQALVRERIEAGLRSGQLTPYEAGRLMRMQWEMEQFRNGFLAGGTPVQAQSCSSRPDLGAMAASGMETASSVMRAIMKEAVRIFQDPPPSDGQSL